MSVLMWNHEQAIAAFERHGGRDPFAGYTNVGRALLTLEVERDALRLRVAALEEALREAARWFDPRDTHGNLVNSTEQRDRILATLSGDTTALRAMLVEAALDGLKGIGYGSREADMDMAYFIADRILGASKEGGE